MRNFHYACCPQRLQRPRDGDAAPAKASSAGLADSEWTLAVEALPSPAGANSAEPQLTIQGDRAILS